MKPPRPNFLIIGSAKCGTTALASILASHPDCCFSVPKEVCFFQDNMDYKTNPNYEKGWPWYKQAFSHYESESAIGEATPSYSDRTRSPNTAQRIFEFNQGFKLIYMVRDPIARQISAWKMQWAEGKDNIWPDRPETEWAQKGFTHWMENQREVGQWDECLYLYQLSAYRDLFASKQIHVMFLEEWREHRQSEIERCLEFLKIDPTFREDQNSVDWHRAENRNVERVWLKRLRQNQVFKILVSAFPNSMRTLARNRLTKVKANCPEPDIQSGILDEFLAYISDDVGKFLELNDKPLDYWKLTQESKTV